VTSPPSDDRPRDKVGGGPRGPDASGLKLRGVDGEVVARGATGQRPPRLRPELDDDEISDLPQRADVERFSGVTRRCPECKKEVFDDVVACYHCGAYMEEDRSRRRVPVWVLATAGLVILGFLLVALRGVVF